MTGGQAVPPIPWRVKLRTKGATWFSPGLSEGQAQDLVHEVESSLVLCGDTAHLLRFPTRYGVHALVRAREVVSVEAVGPRWDGVDDNDRAPGVPARSDDVPPGPGPVAPAQPELASPATAFLRGIPKKKIRGRSR